MPTLPDWLIEVLQVLTVLAAAPGISGATARIEAVGWHPGHDLGDRET